ncbi:MAG TPA: nitrogen regulation protein NR(I) [Acidiferrobacteraceae bacterium]|nr:nitrogen regulation protein NR(I) [Acidiferrobacteraceae bacterium]
METNATVWVIDDDDSIRWVLERALKQDNVDVRCFDSAAEVPGLLDKQKPDVIITDVRMPGMDGLELMGAIKERAPELPVIIMTAHTDLESAVASYKGGAFEYLPKPFDVDDAIALTRRAIQHRQRQTVDNSEPAAASAPEIIGEAASMQEVFRAIGRLSGSTMSVLLNGESGTGKELVARALHNHSPRTSKPFIDINIAAIPRELLESELFGHEKGAFTGAQTQRKGRFEQAQAGTLFLDEIGDMPAELQTRLLRVLSEGKFYRVGGHDQIETDVRIIAATNQDLEKRVDEGHFREDLFHRLNVIRIHLPPLRDRREDVPALADRFLVQAAEELKVERKQLSGRTLDYLQSLDWPGNVRQLENTCRWLTVMAPGQVVRVEDLPSELRPEEMNTQTSGDWQSALRRQVEQKLAKGESDIVNSLDTEFQRILLEAALSHTRGHKQEAAKRLGWGRNTLTRKLKELGFEN